MPTMSTLSSTHAASHVRASQTHRHQPGGARRRRVLTANCSTTATADPARRKRAHGRRLLASRRQAACRALSLLASRLIVGLNVSRRSHAPSRPQHHLQQQHLHRRLRRLSRTMRRRRMRMTTCRHRLQRPHQTNCSPAAAPSRRRQVPSPIRTLVMRSERTRDLASLLLPLSSRSRRCPRPHRARRSVQSASRLDPRSRCRSHG